MPEARLLVVEDNEVNLELAVFLLEEAGFDVRAARDLDEARRALQAEAPDLVLMDMNLHGADGLELVAELRADPRFQRVPVLALTAHAMRGDRERFLAAGCDGYIAKPIDVKSFVQEVARHLAGRRPAGGEGA
jgi:two-component system cell cycle response regulator DivK